MTKKDYIRLANTVIEVTNDQALKEETTSAMVKRLCATLTEDNARFNADKFIEYIERGLGYTLDTIRAYREYINA